jgi:hypothetical protein
MNDSRIRRSQGDWQQVLERYVRAHEQQTALIRRIGRHWAQLSYVRGAIFLLGVALLVAAFQSWLGVAALWWVAFAIIATLFLVVAAAHDRIEQSLETARQRVAIFAEAIARCRRDWDKVATPRVEPPDRFRPVSVDLDVFGQASLVQLFSPVRTAVGLPILADWLTTAAIADEIRLRQRAVSELLNNDAWREEFQLRCRIAAQSPVGSERFLAWIESPSWLLTRPMLVWFARGSAALTIFFVVAFFAGWLPAQVSGVAMMLMIGLNFLTSVFTSGKVHEIFERVSSRKNEVSQYVGLFGQMGSIEAYSDRLRDLRSATIQGPMSAAQGMNSLASIVWLGNLRRHGILFLAYLFLQFVALWDLHLLHWLERWKEKYRGAVSSWFASLGQVEVLAAMATLAYEHPEWVIPIVEPSDPPRLSADRLGHPLLPNDGRVCNDIDVGPPGQVLIVTGSNMSGKSTMLRSIGLNVILAQMGSVVCAARMVLSPVILETSMRIDDSLADGVSFFMAELRRLKVIVDRSLEIRAGGGQFLFLLDEILQGTNSRERHIAVGAVIQQLLDNGAFGAFTTHDLDLASDDGLRSRSQAVYFIEAFVPGPQGDVMTFDYRMRPGVAPTTNALKLLKIVGLSD